MDFSSYIALIEKRTSLVYKIVNFCIKCHGHKVCMTCDDVVQEFCKRPVYKPENQIGKNKRKYDDI